MGIFLPEHRLRKKAGVLKLFSLLWHNCQNVLDEYDRKCKRVGKKNKKTTTTKQEISINSAD